MLKHFLFLNLDTKSHLDYPTLLQMDKCIHVLLPYSHSFPKIRIEKVQQVDNSLFTDNAASKVFIGSKTRIGKTCVCVCVCVGVCN